MLPRPLAQGQRHLQQPQLEQVLGHATTRTTSSERGELHVDTWARGSGAVIVVVPGQECLDVLLDVLHAAGFLGANPGRSFLEYGTDGELAPHGLPHAVLLDAPCLGQVPDHPQPPARGRLRGVETPHPGPDGGPSTIVMRTRPPSMVRRSVNGVRAWSRAFVASSLVTTRTSSSSCSAPQDARVMAANSRARPTLSGSGGKLQDADRTPASLERRDLRPACSPRSALRGPPPPAPRQLREGLRQPEEDEEERGHELEPEQADETGADGDHAHDGNDEQGPREAGVQVGSAAGLRPQRGDAGTQPGARHRRVRSRGRRCPAAARRC